MGRHIKDEKDVKRDRIVVRCTESYRDKVKRSATRLEKDESNFVREAIDEKIEKEGLSEC